MENAKTVQTLAELSIGCIFVHDDRQRETPYVIVSLNEDGIIKFQKYSIEGRDGYGSEKIASDIGDDVTNDDIAELAKNHRMEFGAKAVCEKVMARSGITTRSQVERNTILDPRGEYPQGHYAQM